MPAGIFYRSEEFKERSSQILRLHRYWGEFSQFDKEKAIIRYRNGEAAKFIAKDLNCCESSVTRWVKESNFCLYKTAEFATTKLLLNDLTKPEIAYIAGLIDGEGCIMIIKSKKYPGSSLLQLHVTNTFYPVLEFLFNKLGGHINHKRVQNNNKPCWVWLIRGLRAMKVLEIVQPYLIIKKDKAIEVISFYKEKFANVLPM